MADDQLIKELKRQNPQIEAAVEAAMDGNTDDQLAELYETSIRNFQVGSILEGTVLNKHGDEIVVDVGYKSEGVVFADEFPDGARGLAPGDSIEVLLEAVEDDSGMIVLSKKKADRIRGWERVIADNAEGDIVRGPAIRKIKGGLLVDIGVPVFLPASQISIRRTGDIADYIGQELECKIIKIDKDRRNIVVSRRKLIEERREKQKRKLLAEIKIGELRKGVVKNITDFGAFIDLGGIDGLLHITDMSWGRIAHPSEMLKIDEEAEIMILNVDREKEKISLGLKQKTPSPWVGIEQKYPVGCRARGQVVNIMSYGAFVKLEDGVEGLVHISEMSWTRRINHPSELVAIGDTVEILVLGIDLEKEEISLGMKQTEANPWEVVEEKYPPGTVIKGRVRNLANYGAFIEIEQGIDGLLHISDMSWTKKVNHPSEILKKGDWVETVVLNVNQERKRVALGLKQLTPDPWTDEIPARYHVGDVVHGRATKLTSFGVFVELEPALEGLLHISELADRKIETPEEIVQVGDELDIRIIRVDTRDRKIGLSLRQAQQPEPHVAAAHDRHTERQVLEEAKADRPLQPSIEGLDVLASRVARDLTPQPEAPTEAQPAPQPEAPTEAQPAPEPEAPFDAHPTPQPEAPFEAQPAPQPEAERAPQLDTQADDQQGDDRPPPTQDGAP